MLTGRAIGLVLGGGGARGLAHIGVVRAIEEAGVPIDLVGGTSAGAIIGGQVASGWDSARILAESRRVLVEDGSLNDFTLPLVALLRGNRYIRMLDKLYRERRIEDLPISFFCVSANLTRSTCMVHRSGLARRAWPPVWRCPGSARRSSTAASCSSTAASSTTCRWTSCAASAAGRWWPRACRRGRRWGSIATTPSTRRRGGCSSAGSIRSARRSRCRASPPRSCGRSRCSRAAGASARGRGSICSSSRRA